MDNQHDIESKSLRDHAWTTDEIRKHSSSWTLAGDIGLFNLLNEFSHNIISRTHEVENAVDSLVHQTKMTSAKINNVINDFHMLSNLQFVENRVYDEEVQESVQDSKHVVEKTKEQREAEMLPKFMKAIELGLAVLDTQFDKINVNEISDSEDEDISSEGRTILEPKDPYEHRPLPFIIGSEQFMKCDYAGLKELVEDDIQSFSEESSISETDETSTDEGEPLPLDDDDRFSAKQIDKVSQNISEKISSSDESELFGSEKEVNGFVSDSSLDLNAKENIQRLPPVVSPTKETRQDSVASLQSKLKLPQVLPVPKMQKKEKEEELFTNEAENSDDESPFRKKTGLFTSEIRFDDEKEGSDLFGDDLFGKSSSKDVREIKPVVQPTISSEKILTVPATALDTKKLALFDNDEDSEDDIFNTVIKAKKPTSSKISNAGSQDSSEKADTSSTPSSAPSTKPSGNAFDFVTGTHNDALFGDDSDGDDLFTNKKTSPGKKLEIDNPEEDDLFGIISSQPIKETKVTAQIKPLFEDSKVSNQKETQKYLPIKTKDSIFGDSDSSDQEKSATLKPLISASAKAKKEQNLFDDDFDDDIFMQDTKKPQETVKTNIVRADEKVEKKIVDEKSLFEEKSKQIKKKESIVKKSTTLSIFDDTEEEESIVKKTITPSIVDDSEETKKELTVKKPKTPCIFDDSEELFFNNPTQEESSKSLLRKNQNKPFSLFEESDNFDLFSPKPLVSESKSTVPAQISVPKSGIERTKIPEQTNGIVTSKVSFSSKDTDINNKVSFETPVDNTNVLSVINKSRVKVGTKRRKPTRQGRLAALQNSEKEANADTKPELTISDLRTDDNISDKSFSALVTTEVQDEPPKLNYKAHEKKKMNLMSQLMSEVAVSKIVLNKTSEKVDEMQDEDEVDIFSEAAQKNKSKSSFSFVPSDKNEIASMFPVENKDDIKENFSVSKSDSFDDDFFTEPAFQNFRSSISHKDPVLDLEDSDEDDDLFRTVKTSILPKAKPDTSDPNDLFNDDTDIFANIQKEKYEMFPNQMYEDEDDDDDIFKSITTKSSGSSKANTSSIKKVETQQVKAFEDPLTGLLGDE